MPSLAAGFSEDIFLKTHGSSQKNLPESRSKTKASSRLESAQGAPEMVSRYVCFDFCSFHMASKSAKPGGTKTTAEDTNTVARWKDAVKRELRTFEAHQKGSAPRPYHVNIHKLEVVTRNIGAPPIPVSSDNDEARKELHDLLERTSKLPRDVLKKPITTAQEYGWYSASASDDPFKAPLHRSAEVRFATAYAKSFHVGPFAKTQTMAR